VVERDPARVDFGGSLMASATEMYDSCGGPDFRKTNPRVFTLVCLHLISYLFLCSYFAN
jgi:hypothetical protein